MAEAVYAVVARRLQSHNTGWLFTGFWRYDQWFCTMLFALLYLWDERGCGAEGAGAFVTCANNYIRIKSFPLLTSGSWPRD